MCCVCCATPLPLSARATVSTLPLRLCALISPPLRKCVHVCICRLAAVPCVLPVPHAMHAPGERLFMFEGRNLAINKSLAIFITMNPMYEFRNVLPSNLKASSHIWELF